MPMILLFFFAGKSVSEIESWLSTDLDTLISWFWSNYLMLNVSETQMMLIGTHQRLNVVDIFCFWLWPITLV